MIHKRMETGSLGQTGRERDSQTWVTALRFSSVGIEFGVGAGLGYWAGAWLDRRFGTKPYLSLLLLLLGIAAAFASLLRRVREAQREPAKPVKHTDNTSQELRKDDGQTR